MRPIESIYLPLYSEKGGKLFVPVKSGLNTGRASGRTRKLAETYIRIPAWIHKVFPEFFPQRGVSFTLIVGATEERLKAKVCQDGRKALMSDPNDKLLEAGIRQLGTKPNPYVLEDLYRAGFDSVKLTCLSRKPLTYRMEFVPVDSFETFKHAHYPKSSRWHVAKVYTASQVMSLLAKGSISSATEAPVGSDIPKSRVVSRKEFGRSVTIIASTLNRAKGVCDICGMAGPFLCADGRPFLEVHHVVPLSEGGSDTLKNVAAVCPNCHRACHYSSDKARLADYLTSKLRRGSP